MRQIIIDTETTGLEPTEGHRVIEIGCVELIDRKLTGKNFHHYLNPQREVEAGALAIHGITNEFLANKPTFEVILQDFLSYINGAELIAHNAPFDVGFLNYEIQLIKKTAKQLNHYATIFDTLPMARKMFPGQRNTLDALCKRYKVDLSGRKYHGALLDAHLLAEVYLLMTGGQATLFAGLEAAPVSSEIAAAIASARTERKPLPLINPTTTEAAAHLELLKTIKKISGKCLWEIIDESTST
jgi:DNA polymerase III subunit epsilon